MRRKWIITVLLLGVSMTSFSQGTIKGKLFDSVSNQPMSLATITVFKAIDTTIVTYRLSDPQGNFKVPGLPFNIPLRTVITSSGYKVIRRSFTLTAENSILDFGTIGGYTDTTSLEEFLVIAERPPVTIRKDTIEFNAALLRPCHLL
ncbi:MAG: carboxypeptidase regulatory-like domain-containing protein [Chitinophagaceae bacterium]|nr:carboxypeptidase regulatory-like domain-containing protein [Chitinophagaceae bacterium]